MEGRFLAIQVKAGKRTVITPKRFGKDFGETFALTVQRVVTALREATK